MSQEKITNFFAQKRRARGDSDHAPLAKRKLMTVDTSREIVNSVRTAKKVEKPSGSTSSCNEKPAVRRLRSVGRRAPAERPLGGLLSFTSGRRAGAKVDVPEGKFVLEDKPSEPIAASSTSQEEDSVLTTFDKYKELTEPFSSKKALPAKYTQLKEKFTTTDVILCLRHGRGTFAQVKDGVQRMQRKEYTEQDVGRMLTVLPSAYNLRQEKTAENKYQLAMSLNTRWEEESTPAAEKSNMSSFPNDPSQVIIMKAKRKDAFHGRLMKMVEEQHERFLQTLPVRPKASEVHRWHPRFALNSIPMMDAAELPKPPVSKVCTSARDVLQMSAGALPPRVEKALAQVAKLPQPSNPLPSSQTSPQSSVSAAPSASVSSQCSPATPSLLSLSASSPCCSVKELSKKSTNELPARLLEKIRLKEAEKATLAMMRTSEDELEMERLSSLPDLCQNLCSIFRWEKRDIVGVDTIATKLQQSCSTSQPPEELERRLQLMVEMVPEIQLITMASKGGKWLKFPHMARTKMSDILKRLAAKIKARQK